MNLLERRSPSRRFFPPQLLPTVLLPLHLLILSCGSEVTTVRPADGQGGGVGQSLGLLKISGDEQMAQVGTAVPLPLLVRVTDRQGRPIRDARVEWSVKEGGGSIASTWSTSNAFGEARQTSWTLGSTSGSNRVTASVSGSDLVHFTAVGNPGPPAEVRLAPDPVTLWVGESTQLQAMVKDHWGNGYVGQGAWASDAPGLVSVSSTGLVSGLRKGVARVTATVGGISGSTTVTVLSEDGARHVQVEGGGQNGSVGEPLPLELSLRVTDGSGTPVSGAGVHWWVTVGAGSISPESGVTDAEGVARASWTLGVRPGAHAASVSVEGAGTWGFTASAAPGPVTAVRVTPGIASVKCGEEVRFTAIPEDRFGNPRQDLTIAWTSGNSAVATVSADGTAQGMTAGSVQIQASAGPVAGSAVLQVIAGEGTPNPGTVSDLRALSATSADVTLRWTQVDDGTGAPARYAVRYGTPTVDWASAEPTTLYVTGSVIGTAIDFVRSGLAPDRTYQFQIAALRESAGAVTYGGLSNVVTVKTLSQGGETPQVASVTAAPSTLSLAALDATAQLTANARDVYGNVIAGVGFAWQTLDAAVATVGGSGLVTATGVGSARIVVRAICCAVADTVNVTVSQVPDRVVISPGSTSLPVQGSQALTAAVLDRTGHPIPGLTVVWSSFASAIAAVSSAGIVTGVAPGTTQVRAASGGVEGVATITVTTEGSSPPSNPGTVGDLRVVGTTSGTATLRWTEVSDGTGLPAKYDVRYDDTPLGWGWGQATVVTQGSCSTPVQGQGVGQPITCSVEGLFPSRSYDFQLVAYRGEFGGTIAFGGLSNIATGVTLASGDAPTGVASVTASPSSVTLGALGATSQITATARDASGTVLSGVGFTWQSLSPSVATVSSSGRVTAQAVGTAFILVSATCCTAADTVRVDVDQVPHHVTVTPTSLTLLPGQVQNLSGSLRDANNNVIPGINVSWSSANTSIGIVSSTGLVTGLAPGTTQIRATASGFTASATLTVSSSATQPQVASVVVSPSSVSLTSQGATSQLSATARDGSGSVVGGVTFSWQSLNPSVASVSSSGLVTAQAAGSTSVVVAATCCSAADTVPVTVTTSQGGAVAPAYDMTWPFANMTQLRAHPDYSDSGTADDNMSVLQGLSTPWGGTTAVRRPVNAGYNSVGINWDWPTVAQARAREIWIEIWQRFSPSWHLVGNLSVGGAIDDKTYFWLPNTNVRWELKFMNTDVRAYVNNAPVPGGSSVPIPGGEGNLHDGQWHRVRVHLRMGSNGAYEFWYDDQRVLSATGFDTGNGLSDFFSWCALGRNVEVAAAASMDFGRMRVWTTNPGW